MNIINKPDCQKCGQPALALVSGMWLCGKCVIELQTRIKKAKEKLIMEE